MPTRRSPLSSGERSSPGSVAESPLIDAPLTQWSRGFIAALFAWVFVLGITPMIDTDIWWHLRTAELMWEQKTVPQTDWFTYVDWNQPWIDLHWGFQLLMLAVYNIAGVPGLVIAKATALTAAVCIGWLATGKSLSPTVRALCWLAPIICMSGRALERPEMLSLIFLAYWLWVIPRLESRPRLIWTLPVVQLVWVNCHALFVLGLVVGGCYVADRMVRSLIGRHGGASPLQDKLSSMSLFRAGLLSLVACFVNPYVEEGAFFPATLYRKFSTDQAIYGHSVGEFLSPLLHLRKIGLTNFYLDAELFLFAVTLLSFLWLLIARHRWHPYRILLFAAFSHLAWEASRNTNLFSLVSGVILVANLEDLLRPPAHPAAEQPPWWHSCLRCDQAGLAITSVLIFSVCTNYWGTWTGEGKYFSFREKRDWYMHDAAKFAGRPGMPSAAFVSNFGQAAVYLYHNGPERRVFMDGRLEVARVETFQLNEDLMGAMATGNPAWGPSIRTQTGEMPAVLLDSRYSRMQINGLLQTPGWRLVFADTSGAVFVTDDIAESLSLPSVDPRPLFHPPNLVDL
ncbi:MAG: hypothetical protein O2955_15040 [Planctomycetota bacterium]|nr:hypothetical protein [Planctomycetota bacterium]MDA1213830.1 hypothetical protein [Planctomycetota bacterium]